MLFSNLLLDYIDLKNSNLTTPLALLHLPYDSESRAVAEQPAGPANLVIVTHIDKPSLNLMKVLLTRHVTAVLMIKTVPLSTKTVALYFFHAFRLNTVASTSCLPLLARLHCEIVLKFGSSSNVRSATSSSRPHHGIPANLRSATSSATSSSRPHPCIST